MFWELPTTLQMFHQGRCHQSCCKNTFLTVVGVSRLLSQKVEMVLFLFQKLLVSRELIHVENRLLLLEFKTSHELIYQFFLRYGLPECSEKNPFPFLPHCLGERTGGYKGASVLQATGWYCAPLPFCWQQVSFLGAAAAWWGEEEAAHPSPLLEAIFFAFIEEICLRAPQIDNLRATISLENRKVVQNLLSMNWQGLRINITFGLMV